MSLIQTIVLVSMLAFSQTEAPQPTFVTTIPPLGMIVSEIGAGRAEVKTLLQPGASPHTYDPRPSDAKAVSEASALFYISHRLDGWAANLSARHSVEVIPLLDPHSLIDLGEHGHDHGHDADDHGETEHDTYAGKDAHIWLDPLLVKRLVPKLVEKMCAVDAPGCAIYRKNGQAFQEKLDRLHEQLKTMLAPIAKKPVLVTHAFLTYFLKRYGLGDTILATPVPGREPTPKTLMKLVKTVKARKIKTLFAEVQGGERAAAALAETAGLEIVTLDPLGGVASRNSYAELMLYNASQLVKGLR